MVYAIEVDHLSVSIGQQELLHDICMSVPVGEQVGIIGESGSGKSLLIRAIMGLLPVHARIVHGDIRIFGHSIIGCNDKQMASIRGRIMSMVFQFPDQVLNPVKTVRDIVGTSLRIHYELSDDEIDMRVREQLLSVGLDDSVLNSYVQNLSGGQQQRVAIASALISAPRILIADEPTTALDSVVAKDVCDMLVSKVSSTALSLLFVTHDFMMLLRTAQTCYVMHNGRIVEYGVCRDLMSNAQHDVTRQLIEHARLLMLEME